MNEKENYGERYMKWIDIICVVLTIGGIILFFVGIGLINDGHLAILGGLFIPISITMILAQPLSIPARAHAQMVMDTRVIRDKLNKIESDEYDDDDEF